MAANYLLNAWKAALEALTGIFDSKDVLDRCGIGVFILCVFLVVLSALTKYGYIQPPPENQDMTIPDNGQADKDYIIQFQYKNKLLTGVVSQAFWSRVISFNNLKICGTDFSSIELDLNGKPLKIAKEDLDDPDVQELLAQINQHLRKGSNR